MAQSPVLDAILTTVVVVGLIVLLLRGTKLIARVADDPRLVSDKELTDGLRVVVKLQFVLVVVYIAINSAGGQFDIVTTYLAGYIALGSIGLNLLHAFRLKIFRLRKPRAATSGPEVTH